jgi:hypothetical protein
MAVKVKTKGSSKKGSKSTAKASTAKASSNGKPRRTAEDVDKLVPAFRKHLKAGGKMKELKAEHGFSDDGPIRAALYRAGFDSKGEEHGVEEGDLGGLTAAKLKAALVKERENGEPWYALAYRAGLTEPEVKKIVSEAGGPTGRVYREPAPKATKSSGKSSGKKGKGQSAKAKDPS